MVPFPMAVKRWLVIFSYLLLLGLCRCEEIDGVSVAVGVVLDLNTPVGKMSEKCICLALEDFYNHHPHYRTNLSIILRDSKGDVATAASAALDLMKNEEVHVIVGPQTSSQAKFVIELGEKAQIPIISFSATSPSLSPTKSQYFVRTAQNDSSQVQAIVELVKNYGWQEIGLIYEDTDYGNGLVTYLMDALQEARIKVSNRSSINFVSSNDTRSHDMIRKLLTDLKTTNLHVFLVHMAASTGSRFFRVAKEVKMMREGYAWIVTDGLSSLLDPVSPDVMDAMTGVLGLRPYFNNSEKEIKALASRLNNEVQVSLFGIWAYDTISALAVAVEKAAHIVHFRSLKQNASKNFTEFGIRVSETGPTILKAIKNTPLRGLIGEFYLENGEMVPSTFEIFNVDEKREKVIGYWTPKGGLSQNLGTISDNKASESKLKNPIWPGNPVYRPPKLRIGVPMRHGSFSIFVSLNYDPDGEKNVSGISLKIFAAAVGKLPFPLPFEFRPFVMTDRGTINGTYDDLLKQIMYQKFDAVVGDTTIVDYRTEFVDFTLPYSESGVSMLVLAKPDERDSMWIFLWPLHWDLWLVTALGFIYTGLVVSVLEHRQIPVFKGSPSKIPAEVFSRCISALSFQPGQGVVNKLAKWIIIIWTILVFVISQSYTANLASMLTVKKLQPTVVDVEEIRRNGYFVGYQSESFVKDFLINTLKFKKNMLKSYSSPEEYHDALLNGPHNGGVIAIFDELPYLSIFMANPKYCSEGKFQMVGPTYKTDGFGFAFPIGSPLVSHFSKAILNVTQNKTLMDQIYPNNVVDSICKNERASPSSSESLRLSSFGGLFIISGGATFLALVVSLYEFCCKNWSQEGPFSERIAKLWKAFYRKDDSDGGEDARDPRRTESKRVHPEGDHPRPQNDDEQNDSAVSGTDDHERADDIVIADEGHDNRTSENHNVNETVN